MVQEADQEPQKYHYGTGKRKRAIAKVKLYKNASTGDAASPSQINGKPIPEYFPWLTWKATVDEPFKVTDLQDAFSVVANVRGGGISAQSEAVRHGISRALVAYDESLKSVLRKNGLLTRDSRVKESKKYGLKRARRAPQYTKR